MYVPNFESKFCVHSHLMQFSMATLIPLILYALGVVSKDQCSYSDIHICCVAVISIKSFVQSCAHLYGDSILMSSYLEQLYSV